MNNEFNFESNPYGGFAPQEKKDKNSFAIASLVLGIISILCCYNKSLIKILEENFKKENRVSYLYEKCLLH